MPQPKKLIEVAMPVKEVSAESVRDKSIRHGHISTLHLWWARRPLPVCRAVVFASLVPDPLDEHCPPAFREAVQLLLSGGAYKPYDDIPFTAAVDPLEDNLRNRLLMFIGRFSDKFLRLEKQGKKCPSKEQLSPHSLIKWESKNDERILTIARKLIWVAHVSAEASAKADGTLSPADVSTEAPAKPNGTISLAGGGRGVEQSAKDLLANFDKHYQAIKTAEKNLYRTKDRHLSTPEVQTKEQALHQAIEAFLDRMPRVFDPFAGGGAIPLEAARLGCRAYGNDINPVAHIIQKGSLEFPQRYGKPIVYSTNEFIRRYGETELENQRRAGRVFGEEVSIPNRLAFDVEFYAKKLLAMVEAEIGHYYPADENGNKPIAYYWARVGRCSNPACGAEVPLLRQFYLANRPNKKVFLQPMINGTEIDFTIVQGTSTKKGWINRGNLSCPCCGNITESKYLKKQFKNREHPDRLIAIISSDDNGKEYTLPTNENLEMVKTLGALKPDIPSERLPVEYTKAMAFCLWGYSKWGEIFSKRQLNTLSQFGVFLQKIKEELKDGENLLTDFDQAVITVSMR